MARAACIGTGAVLALGLAGRAAAAAWVQAAEIAPGARSGDADGFSAWVRNGDVGVGRRADGGEVEVTILRVMSPAQAARQGDDYRMVRLVFRCAAGQYLVVGQTGYARNGTELATIEGDGFVRTYAANGLSGVAAAVCDGVVAPGARTAQSVAEAVAATQHPGAAGGGEP